MYNINILYYYMYNYIRAHKPSLEKNEMKKWGGVI